MQRVISGIFISIIFFSQSLQAQSQTMSETPSADMREEILLSPSEKAALLTEMRRFLIASQQILAASLRDDMEAVEAAARPVGMQLLKATPPALREKLPEGFRALGPEAHKGFEAIADEATGLGDKDVILQSLSELQTTCIACHEKYQFVTE